MRGKVRDGDEEKEEGNELKDEDAEETADSYHSCSLNLDKTMKSRKRGRVEEV